MLHKRCVIVRMFDRPPRARSRPQTDIEPKPKKPDPQLNNVICDILQPKSKTNLPLLNG
jgi:hypothetical protein